MSLNLSEEQEIQKKDRQSRTADVSLRAYKALEIVKTMSPTQLASRVNYKKCKDGVAVFEALRSRVKRAPAPITYGSLAGQKMAPLLAAGSLDDVLSVLIEETPDGKWRCDVVLNFTVMGTPEGSACETRQDAEQLALAVLSHLGAEFKPAEHYEPAKDPENKLQIRLNREGYIVSALPEDSVLYLGFGSMMLDFSCSAEALCVALAHLLLQQPDMPATTKTVSLTLLANCGWTHISQEVLDDFCATNGIDPWSITFRQLVAALANSMTKVSQEKTLDVSERKRESEFLTFDREMPAAPTIH
jgi:hypothetical protein